MEAIKICVPFITWLGYNKIWAKLPKKWFINNISFPFYFSLTCLETLHVWSGGRGENFSN